MTLQQLSESDIENLVISFSSKINNGLLLSYKKETIERIREDKKFTDEVKDVGGIYIFIQDGIVKYIGRALPTVGLRKRILVQINAFGDEDWDMVIKDNNTEIGVYSFMDSNQWYFIGALEQFLIEKIGKSYFNKRY